MNAEMNRRLFAAHRTARISQFVQPLASVSVRVGPEVWMYLMTLVGNPDPDPFAVTAGRWMGRPVFLDNTLGPEDIVVRRDELIA